VGFVTAAGFSQDGRRIVTGSNDGIARVWDVDTGRPISRPLRHQGEVAAALFDPGGRFVLTASWDGSARLWDAITGHPVSDPFRHEQRIVAAEWAADGSRFLSVSYDKTAKLWPVFLVPDQSAPGWLADVAEGFGGLRLEGGELFRHLTPHEMLERQRPGKTVTVADAAWLPWQTALFPEPSTE
jgi:hypothetical protein